MHARCLWHRTRGADGREWLQQSCYEAMGCGIFSTYGSALIDSTTWICGTYTRGSSLFFSFGLLLPEISKLQGRSSALIHAWEKGPQISSCLTHPACQFHFRPNACPIGRKWRFKTQCSPKLPISYPAPSRRALSRDPATGPIQHPSYVREFIQCVTRRPGAPNFHPSLVDHLQMLTSQRE